LLAQISQLAVVKSEKRGFFRKGEQMNLLEDLKNYQPYNEQEATDVKEMIYRLETGEELFLRSNLAEHFTASAWVVNPARDKTLMAYHRIYDSLGLAGRTC
jgi:hypothetical protein